MPQEPSQEKPVALIELHDAGVVLHPKSQTADGLGWRHHIGLGGTKYIVKGSDIANLAEAFGLRLGYFTTEVYTRDGATRQFTYRVSDREFLVHKGYLDIGDGYTDEPGEDAPVIEKLWAREDADRLHIRMCCSYEDEEGQLEQYEHCLTYKGSYTVWWAPQKN